MYSSNSKFFEIISQVIKPCYKFLQDNIVNIRNVMFDTNIAVIIFSILVAISIIKNDIAFALMLFIAYILFYMIIMI